MATQKMQVMRKVSLLGRAAVASLCLASASLCSASICNYPATAITNGNPVYTYNITYSPVVAGTIKVEYFTQLACDPYVTYTWDTLKGPYTVSVLQGSPVYVRITVTADHSVQPTVPSNIAVYYFAPPKAPAVVVPAAPTGFKVL